MYLAWGGGGGRGERERETDTERDRDRENLGRKRQGWGGGVSSDRPTERADGRGGDWGEGAEVELAIVCVHSERK